MSERPPEYKEDCEMWNPGGDGRCRGILFCPVSPPKDGRAAKECPLLPRPPEGTLLTQALVDALSEKDRQARGWPLYGFLESHKSAVGVGHYMTVEMLVEQYPPERFPGHYVRSICPDCHGMWSQCSRCDATGKVCSKCRGFGVYLPARGGRAVQCGECDIQKKRAADTLARYWRRWGLTEEEKSWTFANGLWHDSRWDSQPWIGKFRDLATWLEVWAVAPGLDGYRWIVMIDVDGTGNFGIGKSYLCTALVNAALAAGKPAHKWQTTGLLDSIRQRISPDRDASMGVSYAQWFAGLQEFQGIMFLDEFGWEKDTEWVVERLVNLLTYRAERAGWLPTVIVGNVKWHELASTHPWLADRLAMPEVYRPDLSGIPSWRQLLDGQKTKERAAVVAPPTL